MVKVGDKLTRILGGSIPLEGTVTSIDEAKDEFRFNGHWTFRLSTGLEIDEHLGWDGKTVTGSYIKDYQSK